MHLGEIIIPIEYEDIKISESSFKGIFNHQTIYFSLKKGEEKYELAKCKNFQYNLNEVEFVNNHILKKIEFFKDIFTLKDEYGIHIYDYKENLLKTLKETDTLTAVQKNPNSWDKEYLYLINNDSYYFKNGKFEKVLTEENDLYITTYETINNTFTIKTYNKEELERFCKIIETEEQEESLIEIFNSYSIKNEYPTLKLKIDNKN